MKCSAHMHRSTELCQLDAVEGLAVCMIHGGGSPQSAQKSEAVKLGRALNAMVTAIPDSDPEANPVTALYEAHKRCVARIRWLEARIAETLDADSLEFGLTKVEEVGASEFSGINRTFEARVPILMQLLQREYTLQVKLTETMAKTQFKAAELAMRAQALDFTAGLAESIATALGHDARSETTRAAIATALARPS